VALISWPDSEKKNVAEFHSALLFVGTLFFLSFLAGKRKKKPPSDFLLPCVSFTPSLLLLFFCCGRGRAVIPHFAFSSAASSSFYFWGDSAVAIRTNGTHTQQRGHNLCEIFLTCCSSSSLSFPIEETPLVF
jgi:hypothetical protein